MHECPTGYHQEPHAKCYSGHHNGTRCLCVGCKSLSRERARRYEKNTRERRRFEDSGVPVPDPDPPAPSYYGVARLQGDWVMRGVCTPEQRDTLFYPEPSTQNTAIPAAKRVCAGCPVRAECLEWALDNNESDGVWGGMTVSERRKIKRKAALAS